MSITRRHSSYLYVAARPSGGRSVGLRQARDQRQLAAQLRKDRLVPLRAWELPAWASVGPREKLGLKDQSELNTQLSQLLGRGVPLVEALDVVVSAIGSKNRPLVRRMREMVASGTSFADASAATGAFDKVTIAVYRAAERTGDLGGAAKQLAGTMRRQLAIQGKAGTLMLYPAIVLGISVCVVLLMITVIVPKIGDALKGTGKALPWATQLVMDVGVGLRTHWTVALLVFLGLVTACVFGRRFLGELIGRMSRATPFLRDLILAQESTRFFTVMAAMTRCGIPLADALGTATGTLGHPVLKSQLSTLQAKLIEGGVLRALIDGVTALPLPTRRLLIAAERAGDLTPALETLAGDMAEEVERRSARLLAVLEPALIVMMFVIIGGLLLTIMIPILKLSSQAM